MKKVGILTSGGDCQGLNAAIRGVAKALYESEKDKVEIYGIADGYRGLIEGDYRKMQKSDFSGILTVGGTILGTSRQPFKLMRVVGDDAVNKVDAMKKTYKKMGLDALVVLGGNGTQKSANLLANEGLNVVSLPKTIDNDVYGTDVTFGFHSAVGIATNVIDCIHTTATSHGRIFVIEIMGNKAGWLTLYSGVAGGADVILIPEIPYEPEQVLDVLEERRQNGKNFSIIAIAEGAISKADAAMSKKDLRIKRESQSALPGAGYRLVEEIDPEHKLPIRVTVPGHVQRGGSPCAFDRVLTTRFGAAAAKLVREENFGNMVALYGKDVVSVPLSETAGKRREVDPDCGEVRAAKDIGISFADQ